jgi:hypothetical protein
MRKTLWNAESRKELMARLDRLEPDTMPLWGTMSAPQMLAHLANWGEMADGNIATARRPSILRMPPVRYLVIYWLPWPKGVPTAIELISRDPTGFSEEREAVRRGIEKFASGDPNRAFPEHPAFGFISPALWGVLGYRHTDHHLRQFGV